MAKNQNQKKYKKEKVEARLRDILIKIQESYAHKMDHVKDHYAEGTGQFEHLKAIILDHHDQQMSEYKVTAEKILKLDGEKTQIKKTEALYQKLKNLNKTINSDQKQFDKTIDKAISEKSEINFDEIEDMAHEGEVESFDFTVNPDGSFNVHEELVIDSDIAKEVISEAFEDLALAIEDQEETTDKTIDEPQAQDLPEINLAHENINDDNIDPVIISETEVLKKCGNLRGSHVDDTDSSDFTALVHDAYCLLIGGCTTNDSSDSL